MPTDESCETAPTLRADSHAVTASPASATPSVDRPLISTMLGAYHSALYLGNSRASSVHALKAALDRRRAAEQLQEP
jgi:hypothetical protein